MAKRVLRFGHLFGRGGLWSLTAHVLVLSAIPLSLAFGSYLQFQKYNQGRDSLQAIADKAAVAGAWAYFTNRNNTELDRKLAGESEVERVLVRWKSSQTALTNVTWEVNADAAAKRFGLDVRAESATVLGTIPLVGKIPINVSTSIDPTRRALEVALVLDSSASLQERDQFTALRRMAKDYVNDLIDVAGTGVKISVVPWASLVNINSEAPGSNDDRPVHDIDYLIQGSGRYPAKPVADRLSVLAEPLAPLFAIAPGRLAELSRPTQWRGCVRSAADEVSVNSDNIVVKSMDDQPPQSGLWPVALLNSSIRAPLTGRCVAYEWVEEGPDVDNPLIGRPTQARYRPFVGEKSNPSKLILKTNLVQHCIKWSYSESIRQCLSAGTNSGLTDHQNGTLNAFQPIDQDCSTDLVSASPIKTGTDQACLSDPNEVDYLIGGGAICPWQPNAFQTQRSGVWGASFPAISGPNINCPAAILPLSSNRGQILDKLNELYMVPGGSQSDVGLLWALRTLSPRSFWAKFWGLDQQQGASAFGQSARKVVVLITDGRNDPPLDFEGYYGCNRERRKGADRCWRSPNLANLNIESLNALTVSACQVMRETYGISLYVILTDAKNDEAFTLAKNCTGDVDKVLGTDGMSAEALLKSSFKDFFLVKKM